MRFRFFILCCFLTSFAFGQNKQLLYNFRELPQNLMSNPGAETSYDMHVGLPLLSQFHFSAGSSGVSFYDIFREDGGSINDKIGEAISNLDNRDFFCVNQQLEILYVGWRDKKKRYFSAGIYQEMDVFLYFPKDLAMLAWEGNRDHLSETFSFADAGFTAEILNVFHVGFTNYYNKDLNYGVRAKLYSGLFNAHSTGNRGSFRTIPSPGAPNLYRHFMSGMDATIHTSGWASLTESQDSTGMETAKSLTRRAFLGGNIGVGVDLGFTYYLNDQYRVTGSILDLGFLNHYKDVETYRYHGTYQTDGIGLLFPGPDESRPQYWDDWEDHLDENLQDETLYESYMTWRPVKLNASIDFGFNEDTEPCNCYRPTGRREYLHHLSVQWFAVKRPRGFIQAATLAFDKKFSDKYAGKVTYTIDSYSFANVGLLFSTNFKNFNLYLAADNILRYAHIAKAHNASLQFGFQFILNSE